jgi:hypothetical protein
MAENTKMEDEERTSAVQMEQDNQSSDEENEDEDNEEEEEEDRETVVDPEIHKLELEASSV